MKHGMCNTPEYSTWERIKNRCNNPNSADYPDYGGRGIKVCDRWRKSFLAFYSDMGNKPIPNYSLDRINNNGNYEPSNCRWATIQEQANNKRSNRVFTINGATKTLKQWSDELGLKYKTVHMRINSYGWSTERALGIDNG